MTIKVAVLTDLHYSQDENRQIPARKNQYADILLQRAIYRLNRFIKPDLVFIGGDLINNPEGSNAKELLRELKQLLELLNTPYIVIPGNHDPAPEIFYQTFDDPGDYVDINGCRIATFLDRETPGYNAERSKADLERLTAMRQDFSGPLITLQHVPASPPNSTACPYNLDNASEVLSSMEHAGVTLSLAGHFHEGFTLDTDRYGKFVTGPALCEYPFSYYVIKLDDSGNIETNLEHMAWTNDAPLYDLHIHTPLAYCNENMDPAKAIELGNMLNLRGIGFNEHSSHLYFSQKDYGNRIPFLKGMEAAQPKDSRSNEYLDMMAQVNFSKGFTGLELDFDDFGFPIAQKELIGNTDYISGALHRSSLGTDPTEINERFLWMNRKIIEYGIDFLAHPFRVFKRCGLKPPKELYEPLANLLKANDVAVEINYHTNDPDPEFFRLCLDRNIKIVFGSDSHNLYEVGEFYGFIHLIRQLGAEHMLNEILFQPEY